MRPATAEEAHKLPGLDDPIIATLTTTDGRSVEAAASGEDQAKLVGPFKVDLEAPESIVAAVHPS